MTKIKNPILFSVICLILIAVCGGLFVFLSKHEDEIFKTKKTSSYSSGGDYSAMTDSTIGATSSDGGTESTFVNTEPNEGSSSSQQIQEEDNTISTTQSQSSTTATDPMPSETNQNESTASSNTLQQSEDATSEAQPSESDTQTDGTQEENLPEAKAEYWDAESFEADLNAGLYLEGAIVHFVVDEFNPDSFFGYDLCAGEHLNFVSVVHPHAYVGDKVTIKVQETDSMMGSWIIYYEMINCEHTEEAPSSEDTKEYWDESEFEAALNAGKQLDGAIVTFVAAELHPDSELGYVIWAGEHLNFVFDHDPQVSVGDTLTVKTRVVISSFGSWIISCDIA